MRIRKNEQSTHDVAFYVLYSFLMNAAVLTSFQLGEFNHYVAFRPEFIIYELVGSSNLPDPQQGGIQTVSYMEIVAQRQDVIV